MLFLRVSPDSLQDLPCRGPVLKELLKAAIRQRVVDQRLDDRGRGRHHMRAHFGGFNDMHRVADTGDQHLRFELGVVVVDGDNILNQRQAIRAHIIEAANEGGDECGPCFGGEQGLRGRETERDIHHDAVAGEVFAGLEAGQGERHFDGDVLGDLGQLFALAHHAIKIGGDHLGGDGAMGDLADLGDGFLEVTAGFFNQRWVGRHPIQQPGIGQFTDFRNVGGINKKLHGNPLFVIASDSEAIHLGGCRVAALLAMTRWGAFSVTDQIPQATSRAAVLMPALVAEAFDYLVPAGTPEGALVEATLASRALVGAVWHASSPDALDAPTPSAKPFKLKPVTRVIEDMPPLSGPFRQWLDWISAFTLAPKGAVLSLCGLAHAAKTTRKAFAAPTFNITLPTLTAPQQAVATALVEQVHVLPADVPSKPMLLDGVTGSGKTEVYFHAVAAAIAAGKQVLVLVPEIALTHQWLERFETTFGASPVVWHSRMTPAAKTRSWQAVARGAAQVVVGARSALFLPFAQLALIVVDEEHDPSYKQEEGVLYHARDMAVVRAHFEKIPVVLVSATPSLETLENVREGKYRALHLTARYGTAGLPTVRLVDMRVDPPERGQFISPTVRAAMLQTLARGEQVLFFLNRRGYAPLLLCRACGHRFECAQCSAWLVVHGRHRLECHHCGYKEPMPTVCPSCKAEGDKLAACGPGVERIAEEVRGMFGPYLSGGEDASTNHPEMPTLALLSSDEAIAAETWAAIESGAVDILVGTQMVAKGHHFPRLTLVVVVDADVGLDGADLRAGERSYQLLHQLGGRAGRGDLPGTVLVQTYAPEHAVMKALVAHDRDRLMALEASERKRGGWPPFGQLAAILLDGVDEAKVRSAGQMLARTSPVDARIKVLGPAPAPLSKLRGQYRYRLLVKAATGVHLQRTLRGWLKDQKFSGVRIKIDVNPYYFM